MPTGQYARTPKPLADPMPRFWKKVEKTETCWLWRGSCYPDGYGQFWFKGRNVRAPRFAYEQTYGELPSTQFVCHHCDEPLCVRPDHLYAGTQSDNIRDAYKRGRMCLNLPVHHGVDVARHKLTEAQVREIRTLYQPGRAPKKSPVSLRSLAQKYGVSKFAIQYVLKGGWAHLT